MSDTAPTDTREVHEFASVAEAKAFVRRVQRPSLFLVHVQCWLPTEAGRGFEGSTALAVTRSKFAEILEEVARVLVDQRGARIRLRVRPRGATSSGRTVVSLSTH